MNVLRRVKAGVSVPSTFRNFLSIPGVPRLLVSAVVARMPVGMLPLAVVLLIRGQAGSFALAGAAIGAFTLACAGMAPVLGALVDRVGQSRVLGACVGGQTLALLALAASAHKGASGALIIALAAMAGASVPPTMACARALWPAIAVDRATRDTAYALDSVITESAFVLGPLLVIATVTLSSSTIALLLCAALTAVGTAVFVTSRLQRTSATGIRAERRRHALRSPGVRWLLGPIALTGFWWGMLQVGLAALALDAGARWAAGGLLALVSVGSVAGGLWYGARAWRMSIADRYWMLLLVLAVLIVPLVVTRSLVAAVPLTLVAGIALTPMVSCQNTLLGVLAPPGAMIEAFTWATAVTWAGMSGGSAAAGSLVAATGVGSTFVAASSAISIAGLIAAVGRRHISATEPSRGAYRPQPGRRLTWGSSASDAPSAR